jgi:hypothetical protein
MNVMSRAVSARSARVLMAAGLIVGLVMVMPARRAEAVIRTASCTEGGVTWRVTYDAWQSDLGPAVNVTALARVQGGQTTDAGAMTWELRYENHPSRHPAPSPPPTWPASYPPPFESVRGTLTAEGIGRAVIEHFSPRLVTPDGACTVYLSPFRRDGTQPTWPKVAVLGDDLVHQLNDSSFNLGAYQGYAEAAMNDNGIRAEVEGHTGARWVGPANPDPLTHANGHLTDEFKGLLEHDIDGVVVTIGTHDALWIAGGATPEERTQRFEQRRWEIQARVDEMAARVGCVQLVTIPEQATNTNHAAAAQQLNNHLRWFGSAREDGWDVTDFADRAHTHRAGSTDAWFQADNVHLNPVGTLVYTATVIEAAKRCAQTVQAWGRPGSFDGPLASKAALPTGQSFRTRGINGWQFLPGRDAYLTTNTADGTVLVGNMSQSGNSYQPTGDSMVISAMHPEGGSFTNIRLKTDKGLDTLYRDPFWGPTLGVPGDIGDLEAYDGGNAVVFTNASPGSGFQNDRRDGFWPVFGLLTNGPGGWNVAEGTDAQGNAWKNQWTPIQLYDASPDKAKADLACPKPGGIWGEARDCRAMQEVAVLPHSNDIVIAQYFGAGSSGQLTVVDVDPVPGTPGRYKAEIAAVHPLPEIPDPSLNDPNLKLWLAPLSVSTDPTSAPGDERFAVTSDTAYRKPNGDLDTFHPKTVIEFAYNESARTISPRSAPILPGGTSAAPEADGLRRFLGVFTVYDRNGNLWAATAHGYDAFETAVWAKHANGRRLSNGTCPFNGGLTGYEATATGVKDAWGVLCEPDYKLLQARAGGVEGVVLQADPVTGDIISNNGNDLQVIRPSGSGASMTFQVSNVVQTMGQSIVRSPRPCPGHPELTCNLWVVPGQAPPDGRGRMWTMQTQLVPPELRDSTSNPTERMLTLDQWLFSTDMTRLFGRGGHRLPTRAGQAMVVQAEQTSTFDTDKRTQGDTELVDSKAFVLRCGTCGYTGPGDPSGGLMLGDDTGGGVAASTEVTYRVVVPKGGSYQVRYRATDRATAGTKRIRLRVDGTTVDQSTTITSDAMAEAAGPTITFPGPGTWTVRLSPADAASAGWQLDWLSFTRT